MMINVKSFFRKPMIKIYISILCLLIISMLTLFSFINYYAKLSNKIFEDNTIFLISGNTNYFSKLIDMNLENVNEILVFEPYLNNNLISEEIYVTGNESSSTENNTKLTWSDLIISDFSKIIVKCDTLQELKDNEIKIGLKNYILNFKKDYLESIVNESVGFTFENSITKFQIKEFYENQWPEITISHNKYEELKKISTTFSYQAVIKDYRKSYDIKSKISNIDKKNLKVTMESSFIEKDSSLLYSLDDPVSILKIVSYIAITIFAIIYFVVLKNILVDCQNEINLNYILGYKNKKNKLILLINLTLMIFITISISFGLCFCTNFLLNKLCDLNLEINLTNLLIIFIFIIFINFINILRFKIERQVRA